MEEFFERGGRKLMNNKKKDKRLRIMTHMVAYYPDREESKKIAESLLENGAHILEVQFPFSDPTADGKYIEMACTAAIKEGFTIKKGFEIIKEISKSYRNDIFIMSYANLAFFHGIDRWVKDAKESGVTGLIIPDLPFDYDEGLYEMGKSVGINIIPVITPDISNKRLEIIMEIAPRYIYTTLRRGITGSITDIDIETIKFLEKLNSNSKTRILAGFGIYSRSQIETVSDLVYAVVVGSAFIKAINKCTGKPPHIAVAEKLKELIGK
ncbi:MAG TPA: tryptophan synthase subunit alpha [Desulfobacteraceae bacterium]|nr:tryptophan synthase subunit alpha [Desulfobacteraceae bacterium]